MNKLKKFLMPHIYTKRLTDINYEYLKKELGIKILLIDKDDTLTLHHHEDLHEEMNSQIIKKMIQQFESNIYIISNSRRKWKLNWKIEELDELTNKYKAFRRYDTKYKKPLN